MKDIILTCYNFLFLLQTDAGPARHTYLAKLLFATEDCLYVADASLNHIVSPAYVTVSTKPSCFIPSQISANRAAVVHLEDILLDKGMVFMAVRLFLNLRKC
jgi:hypothetical protein